MKKTILMIFILFTFLSCKKGENLNAENNNKLIYKEIKKRVQKLKKKIKAPKGVNKDVYTLYLAYYGPTWSKHSVSSGKTLTVFKNYFNDTPYRVIWNWDIDGDGYKDYLGVEVQPNIRRGIKRGILVDENGKVKMYIDTVKGIYAPDYSRDREYMILDLKKLGIKKGELSCYAIGYIPPQKKGEGKTHYGISFNINDRVKYNNIYEKTKAERKRRGLVEMRVLFGRFYLQCIDKDFKVIGAGYKNINAGYRLPILIYAYYFPKGKKVIFHQFTLSFDLESFYRFKKRSIIEYRKAKKQGLVFSPPERLNSNHVKIALKIKLLY